MRYRQPKGRHRDLEARALAALPAEVQIMWMKAHQSDKDAEEGRVDRVDLQGNHKADVAANNGTREHVPFEPSEEWKQWGTVCQPLQSFWLLVGPKLRIRPEKWPPGGVELAVLPAAPFVVGPHQRVVEHETYDVCLNCSRHVGIHTGRKCFNYGGSPPRPELAD
eukprot:3837126-Amphidinium_carterae.1